MPSLMVYTEETFYYEDKVHVVARDEFMKPDMISLTFYNEMGFWFGMEYEENIYSSSLLEPVLEMELRRYGHESPLMYSRKHISYSFSDKTMVDTLDFYITKTDFPNVLSVMEQINRSDRLRSYEVNLDFHDFPAIRQYTDSIFYSSFTYQQ